MIQRLRATVLFGFLLSGIMPIGGPATGFAGEKGRLSLDGFLSQVKSGNAAVQGALAAREAGQLRTGEADLMYAPTLNVNEKTTIDSKLPPQLFLLFSSTVTQTFSLGVSKLTSFGLQANLHYDLSYFYYNNPVAALQGLPGASGLIPTVIANASPILELTQSLWSNGFGRSTRANADLVEAQALASSYNASFQAQTSLSQAETTYWRLALVRKTLEVQKEALDRAEKIHEWNSRRARLQLADQADALQAEAMVQSRRLDLLTAQNDLRSASRQFNSIRNIDSDEVAEKLEDFTPEMVEHIKIPERAQYRYDVKAAQQNAKVTQANAAISLERDLPTFEAYVLGALNGQQGNTVFSNMFDAMASSVTLNRPTGVVGLRLVLPMDFSGTGKGAREGWRLEQVAAEKNLDRKLFEQEQSWKDLTETFSESQKQLVLSRKLEEVQLSKLTYERNRLQRGRSTTYQVLLFEQDYLISQLGRIRSQANLLNLVAQLKLFGDRL